MGYNTDLYGEFKIDRPVDDETKRLLDGLATTRRMKRKVGSEYGVDGEFYFNHDRNFGQSDDETIVNHNAPPSTQPGLWCQWALLDDRQTIEWDGVEKFYEYVEWIQYLIDHVLKPRGYVVNGEVEWKGEDSDDLGKIVVMDNEVKTLRGEVQYIEE